NAASRGRRAGPAPPRLRHAALGRNPPRDPHPARIPRLAGAAHPERSGPGIVATVSAGRGIPVLRIDVSASHRLAAALALAHAMALGSVLVAVPQWTWRLFAALVLGASAWRTIARHALRLG